MSKKHKILHIVHAHSFGSLERYIISLIKKLDQLGFESELLYIREEGSPLPEAEECTVVTHQINKSQGSGRECIFQIKKLIKSLGCTLIHTHDCESVCLGTLAAKLAWRKCIHTKHVRTAKAVASWIYNLNTFIIPVSQDIKYDLLKYNRIPKKKIRVVFNGVDLASIDRHCDPAKRKERRKELKISEKAYVIGNIGRLCKEEDQASLIKALKKMVSRDLDAHVLICGEGPMKEEILKVAKDYQVADRVNIVSDNGHPGEILNLIDCYCLNAFNEGRPLSLLQAMAARKPVIATTVGANKEVVEEPKTGYLVPCGFPERIHSAVMMLNAIETLSKEIGEAGRKKVEEKFTIEITAKAYFELYQSL